MIVTAATLDEIEGEELRDGSTEDELVIMIEPEEVTVTLNDCMVVDVTHMLTVATSLTNAELVL